MSKLSDILARQKAQKLQEKGIVNATHSSTKSGASRIQNVAQNSPIPEQKRQSEIPVQNGSAIIGGLRQEETSVVIERLSPLERLKQKKAETSNLGKPIAQTVPTQKDKEIELANFNPIPRVQEAENPTTKGAKNTEVLRTNDAGQNSNTTISKSVNEGVNEPTIDLQTLRRNLDYLANNIEQKELVGQVVRTIAVQLKNSPELTPYMSDADVDLVVRGLRRAYNIAARKKTEARETKAKKSAVDDELMQAFKDIGFGA